MKMAFVPKSRTTNQHEDTCRTVQLRCGYMHDGLLLQCYFERILFAAA